MPMSNRTESDNTSIQSIAVATLGVPRIGPRRELKAALESYWAGKIDADALRETAAGRKSVV